MRVLRMLAVSWRLQETSWLSALNVFSPHVHAKVDSMTKLGESVCLLIILRSCEKAWKSSCFIVTLNQFSLKTRDYLHTIWQWFAHWSAIIVSPVTLQALWCVDCCIYTAVMCSQISLFYRLLNRPARTLWLTYFVLSQRSSVLLQHFKRRSRMRISLQRRQIKCIPWSWKWR